MPLFSIFRSQTVSKYQNIKQGANEAYVVASGFMLVLIIFMKNRIIS